MKNLLNILFIVFVILMVVYWKVTVAVILTGATIIALYFIVIPHIYAWFNYKIAMFIDNRRKHRILVCPDCGRRLEV